MSVRKSSRVTPAHCPLCTMRGLADESRALLVAMAKSFRLSDIRRRRKEKTEDAARSGTAKRSGTGYSIAVGKKGKRKHFPDFSAIPIGHYINRKGRAVPYSARFRTS